jgi:hypothetical protein
MIEPTIQERLVSSTVNEMVGGVDGAFTDAFTLACPTCTPGRFYPVVASENTPLPFIVYSVEASNEDMTLSGSDGVTQHTVAIDVISKDFNEGRLIAIEANSWLHKWRDVPNSVLLSRLLTSGSDYEEIGYHYALSYSLNYRTP